MRPESLCLSLDAVTSRQPVPNAICPRGSFTAPLPFSGARAYKMSDEPTDTALVLLSSDKAREVEWKFAYRSSYTVRRLCTADATCSMIVQPERS